MNTLLFPLQLAGPNSPTFAPPYPTQQCQVSDGGVTIAIQVLNDQGLPVNLRLSSKLSILIVRPSSQPFGAPIHVPAQFYTNGLDGIISFETGPGTPFGAGLNESGVWNIQGRFTLSSHLQYTSIGSFYVNANLGA